MPSEIQPPEVAERRRLKRARDKDCRTLSTISADVARWLLAQPAVGEPSITDWLLYEVARRIPWVHYRKFTQMEEARETGADWEWWFVFRAGAVGMRVQAKKVAIVADNYQSLARTNRYGLQIECLIESARMKNLLAVYTLYCRPHPAARVMCPRFSKGSGAFVASASNLYRSFIAPGRQEVAWESMLSKAIPLPCMICCDLARDRGFRGFYDHLHGLFAPEIDVPGVERPGYHAQPPPYISSFLENHQQGLPEWWEREFASALAEINALWVFDLREFGD